ncbi:general secretion pathway protein GspB [Celerinatantimonas diazotrophica]|uniref:Type II secretion system (T2SS) protein B n=1 Tax=Celerinatantimonas diazotrophica TaxID=412034 RepID=A0A4R1J8V8_9GAMM|nr:general secretion pathway protein GspB [Celerinatantimonas diazotrophica]TCK47008.1 type II secretion system (T2SS) protein B [Celerinatantimonas diazotrophica]CAG9295776.1 hypothetical protein CEDIAZO_00903 [Celerinatantimonas diazotrophica]
MNSSTSSRFWFGYSALLIAGIVITGYGGYWSKIHLAQPKLLAPIGQKIDFPALHAIEQPEAKKVDLIALREQQLAEKSGDVQTADAQHVPVIAKQPLSDSRKRSKQPIIALTDIGATMHIPAFVYNAHVFSSDPSLSYIQLNGRTLHQGDHFLGMTVVKILYGKTIFKIKNRLVEQPALEDFKP